MRLVNTRTLRLEEFVEGSIPDYAILSHKWTDQELTFKEVYKDRVDKNEAGYKKLVEACRIAVEYGLSYIWVDTCCIDKRSSAELSEAINSMYAWYENSKVCLAYLQDVKSGLGFETTFQRSIWFRRSWTLQELIAPRDVRFFDGDWNPIGNKISRIIAIKGITGIPRIVLKKTRELRECSIAMKMSWAADRNATRTEDLTYSLLGIFAINMPLLYGEGSKAFFRLQQEIIRQADDTTIFFWGSLDVLQYNAPRYLLARCPSEFRTARDQWIFPPSFHNSMAITNIGIDITVNLVRWNLYVYGIIIASGKLGQCALLVSKVEPKRTGVGIFGGVGVVALPRDANHRLGVTENRKITIVWGSGGPFYEGTFPWSALDGFKHGFNVEADIPYSLRSVVLNRPIDYERVTLHRVANAVHSSIVVDFGDPMHDTSAVVEYRLNSQLRLFIELTFDFDSDPVALIHSEDSIRDHGWHGGSRALYTSIREHELMDDAITVAAHKRTGHKVGFFRCSSYYYESVKAKIPEELLITNADIWIAFLEPPKANDSWWKFSITTKPPPPDSHRAVEPIIHKQ